MGAPMIPEFTMGNAAVDFSPITNALARWQQSRQQDRVFSEGQRQFNATNALAQGRFGMEKAQFDEAQARLAEWKRLNPEGATPAWAGTLPPGVADLARVAGPSAAPNIMNMLANQPDIALRREMLGEQIAARQQQSAQHAQTFPLEVKKLDAQVRAMDQKDPEREFMSNLYRKMQDEQQRQGQPQQPQSGFLPQSFNGGPGMPGGDPNLVLTQGAGQQPKAAPQQEMVDVPGVGRVSRQLAEQMRLALAKDKGEVLKEAIGKTDLDKSARSEIDKKEEKATDGLLRLRNIRASFDPDFLTYGTQVKMRAAEIAAKAGKLDAGTQEKLYRFATFRRDAANNFNAILKDNSGATVTEQEMRRNGVDIPNAGSGIFDGDDPVTFQAKLDRGEQVIALGIARTRYLRQNGFTGPIDAAAREVPIEKMREIINGRARQIETELRKANPQMQKPIVDRQVDLMVKKEFGI